MEENARRTLYRPVRGIYEEKKSRFLCDLFYVRSEEEAAAALAGVRKAHYDARHHCSAEIFEKTDGGIFMHSSDDGEPQGTAGKPMLEVLQRENLTNILAVVTRYFGGTLLGTGGLVRSYTKAVQDAVANSEFLTIRTGVPVTFSAPYTLSGKLEYLIESRKIPVIEKTYEEAVRFRLMVPEEETERLRKVLFEASGGQLSPSFGDPESYALYSAQVLTGKMLRPL